MQCPWNRQRVNRPPELMLLSEAASLPPSLSEGGGSGVLPSSLSSPVSTSRQAAGRCVCTGRRELQKAAE